jgi:hypothetical protein
MLTKREKPIKMIGFSHAYFLEQNHIAINYNRLHFFIFNGTTFGISAMNIKIHSNEKSS